MGVRSQVLENRYKSNSHFKLDKLMFVNTYKDVKVKLLNRNITRNDQVSGSIPLGGSTFSFYFSGTYLPFSDKRIDEKHRILLTTASISFPAVISAYKP
jgi:archaellum component FlaF (FlaF/FlaG flagellin family)